MYYEIFTSKYSSQLKDIRSAWIASALFLFCFVQLVAQEKDNSKPTNLYSQVDNFLEFTTAPDHNTYGYNPRISYAMAEDLSFVLEVPFRYHDKTKKFGLGEGEKPQFFGAGPSGPIFFSN